MNTVWWSITRGIALLLLLFAVLWAEPVRTVWAQDAVTAGGASLAAPLGAEQGLSGTATGGLPQGQSLPQHAAAGAEPSVEQMIGAMLMLGFRGAELAPDDPFLQAVRAGRVGHVLLFDRDVPTGRERNIRSPEQLRALCATLRGAASGPFFIAVDQEGGQVRRLKPQKGFLDIPSAQRMGQGPVPDTGVVGETLGQELHSLGINVDLAPVADVNVNPFNPAIGKLGRSFNTDPRMVAEHALAFGTGLLKHGVIPALKHFPGQGGAEKDSHLGLTDITTVWQGGTDLLPFAEAINRGWTGMIMVGHVFHRGLDARYPATLSALVVTGLLRQGLGWQGVVISDDMQMQAITAHYGFEQAMLLAIRAGVDILVYGNNLVWEDDLPQRAFATLKHLVDSGQVTPQRLRQSWDRITALYTATQP